MGKTSIMSFVSIIMIAVSVLIVSGLENDEQPPMCRRETEVCLGYGEYSCCEGLICFLWTEHLPVGGGICTPSGQTPQPPQDECQKRLQLCTFYGNYQCCNGLTCIVGPNLPLGVGICT